MNISKPLLLLSFLSLGCFFSQNIEAAPQKQKNTTKATTKTYRWVDAQGKVHYSDTIPADAVQEQHQEINRSGRAVGTIEKAKTVEDVKLAQQQAEIEEQQKKEIKNAQQIFSSYPTEEHLHQDYQKQKAVYEGRLAILQTELKNKNNSLIQKLSRAADVELQGKKVSEKQKQDVLNAKSEIDKTYRQIQDSQNSIAKLHEEELKTLALWKAGQPQS